MAEGSWMWAISLLTIMLLTLLSAAPIDINGDIKKEDVQADNDGMHSHDENVTRGGKFFGHNQFDIGNINVPGSVAGDDVSIGHKVNIDVQGHAHDYHEYRHNEDDTVIECKEGLREMFKSIDSNKDGLIDAMELFRVCHQNNIQIKKLLAVRILTLPDKTVGFNIAKFCELLKDSPSTNIADSINFLLQLFDKVPLLSEDPPLLVGLALPNHEVHLLSEDPPLLVGLDLPNHEVPLLSEDPPLLLGSAPTNNEAVGTCDSGTICGQGSLEPITDDIIKARKYACMLGDVEFITPLYPNNPKNVKNVEAIVSEQKFKELFPNRNAAYTYENFLKAIGKFPSICAEATTCKKILVNMFGHFGQETAGLQYVEEIQKGRYCGGRAWALEAYPCQKGKQYYGRGSKQLTHNYNYGAFSNAMFGTPMLLLNQPELVATTWLNFASGMWFFVTPQSPKPSILDVVEGRWQPNSVDKASGVIIGFGTSIRIINGGEECGSGAPHPEKAVKRAEYYVEYASKLDLDISGEQLSCASMGKFSTKGSNGAQKLYWNSPSCNAGTWQSPYNALVEGDYARCLKISLDVTKVVPPECIPQAVSPVIIPENWISSGPNKGRCGAEFVAPSGVVAECDPNSIESCCSKWGYCGHTDSHCNCDGCKKFT